MSWLFQGVPSSSREIFPCDDLQVFHDVDEFVVGQHEAVGAAVDQRRLEAVLRRHHAHVAEVRLQRVHVADLGMEQ